MSSMEPSLQPSFTFPSRHVLQNYAKGITDLSSATQRLLVKPKYNTDINIETALHNVLTIPKTLDKDVIDVKAVIPVTPNIYVQPGLAEGMTNLAKLTDADKTIVSTTSANNALKRGNYKAAEKLVGRPLTVEELQNRTITPETRSSEKDPNIKYGVSFNDVAFGAQVDPNSQFNFHQREKMLKESEPFFVNEMARHYGIDPNQVRYLKTQMGFTGDSVLGYYKGTAAQRESIRQQFEYAWAAMQAGMGPQRMEFMNEFMHDPIHTGQRAERAQAQDTAQRAQEREPARFRADANGNVQDMNSAFPPPPVGPEAARVGHRLARAINDNGPVNMEHDQQWWDEEKRENFPPPPREFQGSSDSPMEELSHPSYIPAAPPGPPIIHPQVLERVVVNAPIEQRRADENNQRLRALAEANIPRRDEDMSYFPPDHVDLNDSDMKEQSHPVHPPGDMMGDGIGGHHRRRTMKKQRFHPYVNPQRFTPQTDGFYGPAGGVVSGNLMRQTGQNAVPLSAQIQVANTHQWTETPLQEWIHHPNMSSDIKPRPIPISQNIGVPKRAKKVMLGNYMIDHHKLMSGGVLSVSHKTGKKVKGMPNTEVSPGMREVIHAIITGQKVNTKKLTGEERLQLKELMHKSVANVDLGGDVNVSPTKQLSLILGEIEAGNDSAQLKTQLRKLLPSLKRGKCITPEQAADISKHYL